MVLGLLNVFFLRLYPDLDDNRSTRLLRLACEIYGLKTRTRVVICRDVIKIYGVVTDVMRFGRFIDPVVNFAGLLSISKCGNEVRGLRAITKDRRYGYLKVLYAFGCAMTCNLGLRVVATIAYVVSKRKNGRGLAYDSVAPLVTRGLGDVYGTPYACGPRRTRTVLGTNALGVVTNSNFPTLIPCEMSTIIFLRIICGVYNSFRSQIVRV